MTPEEALQIADEALLSHAGSSLADIQRMILRESMAGTGYEKMEGYTPQHIKNEGKKLWDLLSNALGETVSKKNFKGALEKWWRSRQVILNPPSLSVYDVGKWVGRSSLINELLPKLQDKTRLVWITGIPGIGKTTLGECLASRAWESNPTFQWVYLEVLEGQGADFTTIAADLLAKLGDRELDPQERNDPKRLTDRLIRKLQSSFYWVQLDSLERLLNPEQGTEFSDVHWVTFLQRCLTERDFGSRLVLTAQALPSGLVEFADRYPNVWQARTLVGLSADGPFNEHLEFFGKHGVAVDEGNQAILSKLGQVYEGHTLVLQVMSGEIQADFGGDVGRYWAMNQQEFEQVARSLDAKRLDETEYNDELDRRVRDRVKQSLQQLPRNAQGLLLRSSVYRRPVPKKFWLAMIDDRASSQQKEAYRVLCDRALVEREGMAIRQHNLIRAVACDLLKADCPTWRAAERQAAQLWLTAYEPAPEAPNLETVRGYLEAFYHYCILENWEACSNILQMQIDSRVKEPLYLQLDIWGCFREQIDLFRKIIGKRPYGEDANWIRRLGASYYYLGNYAQAILYYEQSQVIARHIGDRSLEGRIAGNIGSVYYSLGHYEHAIDAHNQYLTIAREIGDRLGEGSTLGNLGTVYERLGQYDQAIEAQTQYLAIAREIGDRRREGRALGNLGLAYDGLGQYEQAIYYHQQYLMIMQEICDLYNEGNAFVNMGATQLKLKHYPESLTNNQRALEIFQEIGFREGEAGALKNLAQLHQALGEVEMARQYCQQALALATELGIPLADECRKLQEEIENSISVSSE